MSRSTMWICDICGNEAADPKSSGWFVVGIGKGQCIDWYITISRAEQYPYHTADQSGEVCSMGCATAKVKQLYANKEALCQLK